MVYQLGVVMVVGFISQRYQKPIFQVMFIDYLTIRVYIICMEIRHDIRNNLVEAYSGWLSDRIRTVDDIWTWQDGSDSVKELLNRYLWQQEQIRQGNFELTFSYMDKWTIILEGTNIPFDSRSAQHLILLNRQGNFDG